VQISSLSPKQPFCCLTLPTAQQGFGFSIFADPLIVKLNLPIVVEGALVDNTNPKPPGDPFQFSFIAERKKDDCERHAAGTVTIDGVPFRYQLHFVGDEYKSIDNLPQDTEHASSICADLWSYIYDLTRSLEAKNIEKVRYQSSLEVPWRH